LDRDRHPAASPVRLPAEWEPHAATWIAWPHRRRTWLGPFEPIPRVYERLVRLVAGHEPVRVIGGDELLAEPRRLLGDLEGVAFVEIPTDDSWLRDTGPVFLLAAGESAGDDAPRSAVAWGWNAWGGKYPPWENDARVACRIAEHLGLEVSQPSLVLEGGGIETDGEGTLLANPRCLVDPRRNPGVDRAGIEAELRARLGIEQVLWASGELAGDDTDGHIDQLARFVAPGRVVVARQPDRDDPNHGPLEETISSLRRLVDAAGRRLEVVPIEIPSRFSYEGVQLPASHLNYYVANGLVVVPVFAAATDEPALRRLEECFPGRRVEPFDCRELIRGRGGVHCITRDEPRER